MDVAVLLSGGVDSSLALRLLVAAGHRVTAFYLQIWFQASAYNQGGCPPLKKGLLSSAVWQQSRFVVT